MIIGFTGTRDGMTDIQKTEVEKLLMETKPEQVHHGDCIGADKDFHDICVKVGISRILIHPGDNPQYRANCQSDFIMAVKGNLLRNKDIVDSSILMIACPRDKNKEEVRSGTWYTIRYAKKRNKRISIL